MWLYYYVIKCGNLVSYDESASFYDDRYHFNFLRVYWIIIVIGEKIDCIQIHLYIFLYVEATERDYYTTAPNTLFSS